MALDVCLHGEAVAERDLLPEPGGLIGEHARAADAVFSRPLTASALSRTISAGRRKRGPRASRRFSGSFSSRAGVTCEMLAVRGRRDDQPLHRFHVPALRMNSVASQSSNSGCDGGSPCDPKFSAVLTSPMPKYICQ